MSKATVFISHSRQDETEKNELISHLGVLEQEGIIDTFVDNRIGAGDDWVSQIAQAITQARIAILLITNNYLSSEFILQTEVAPLLERQSKEGLVIFPVIAKNCAWRNVSWLVRMKVRPKSEQPVWREGGRYVDEELAAISEEIAGVLGYSLLPQSRLSVSPGGTLMSQPNGIKSRMDNKMLLSSQTININYECGLEALRAQLEQTNRYTEFTGLEARLYENLQDEQLYGPNDGNRSQRARIVNSLNKLALETLKLSFNDLALGRVSAEIQTPSRDLSLVRQLNVTLTPDEIIPPVQTHLQDLPFNELSWEQFEALCAALVEAQPITIDCHLYGVQGDEQQGIDVVTTQRGANGTETWAYQCKRYKTYTPKKLKDAVEKMIYPADYYVLMLSIPATASVRKVSDEQANVFLWDAKDISRKLKNFPTLVEDFFGKAWREAFCIGDQS